LKASWHFMGGRTRVDIESLIGSVSKMGVTHTLPCVQEGLTSLASKSGARSVRPDDGDGGHVVPSCNLRRGEEES
jgi:hypothetical protein